VLDRISLAIYVLTAVVLLSLAGLIFEPLGAVELVLGLVLALPVAIVLSRAWKARFGT
jgi:hypothetical protein